MDTNETLRSVRRFAREKYAWPGGYPMILVMKDGEVMCADCAKQNYRLISRATRDDQRTGWEAAGVDIHWEGPPEHCCNCNNSIASAYGRVGLNEEVPHGRE